MWKSTKNLNIIKGNFLNCMSSKKFQEMKTASNKIIVNDWEKFHKKSIDSASFVMSKWNLIIEIWNNKRISINVDCLRKSFSDIVDEPKKTAKLLRHSVNLANLFSH